MQVKYLIERFLKWHQEHNKPSTCRFYGLGLKWVLTKFGDREWADLKRDEVRDALQDSKRKPDGTPYAPDTQRRNTMCFNQLQKWSADQYDAEILLRPKDLKKPTGRRRERIPTEEELESIFLGARATSPDCLPPTPYTRLEVAFRSLAQSGCRPNELVRAKIKDLSPERDLILLKDHKTATKTGKSRRIPLGKTLRDLVLLSIGARTEGPIWLDELGKEWTVCKLSCRFRQIRDTLGLSTELVLYSFRHYKGTMVARKYDIHAASIILAHSQISTTARYAHPDDDDARKWQE